MAIVSFLLKKAKYKYLHVGVCFRVIIGNCVFFQVLLVNRLWEMSGRGRGPGTDTRLTTSSWIWEERTTPVYLGDCCLCIVVDFCVEIQPQKRPLPFFLSERNYCLLQKILEEPKEENKIDYNLTAQS